MTSIWYCPQCGYEIDSRGRCHSCKQKLVASELPELPPGDDEEEVGYRLDGWSDRDRGRLIERLNTDEVLHRFEEDELVVAAEDEARIDDMVAEIAATPEDASVEGPFASAYEPIAPVDPELEQETTESLRLLVDAARRLRVDPTDMNADADVAQASTSVFLADDYPSADHDTWAAIGRVTRRLLAALGAEEALEDEIRIQAAILSKLLAPVLGEEAIPALENESEESETVYELPDWLPEQRAQLGVLLDQAGVLYEWEAGDLIVPAEREAEVEQLFGQVTVAAGDDDDVDDGGETRYHALEELFAASDRLASAPEDEERAQEAVEWIDHIGGAPPIGFDEVVWIQVVKRARALSESIEAGRDEGVIGEEAAALRDVLRRVV